MTDMLDAIRRAVGTEAPAKPPASTVADHPDFVEARREGFAKGERDARERMQAILTAPGIAGNGRRMTCALDLAGKAMDMSAERVVEAVMLIIPDQPAVAPEPQPEQIDHGPLPGSGLVFAGLSRAAARHPLAAGGDWDRFRADQQSRADAVYQSRRPDADRVSDAELISPSSRSGRIWR
jgi:hypothetical protein